MTTPVHTQIRRLVGTVARVVIAEDHPLFRSALAGAVARVQPTAQVVECSSLAQTIRAVSQGDAALVLLDLKLPDCEGFAGVLALRTQFPATPVVIVSAAEEPSTARTAISLGAAGFIPKSADMGIIAVAIEAVLGGETWIPADMDRDAAEREQVAHLTPTQLRILAALQRGSANKKIAYEMGVSEATIKGHITIIFRKLGVTNRTQAVLAARNLSALPR